MIFKFITLITTFLFLTNTLLNAEDFTKVKIDKLGEIIKNEEFKDQNIKRITFSNHIVVNLKKTDYKKDSIIFHLNFGKGVLSLPPGKEGMAHFAQQIYKIGGLNKTTEEELRKAIVGKNVSANFSILENYFIIQAKTTPQDLELNLQLCRAKLTDSAFPETAFQTIKNSLDEKYLTLKTEMGDYFKNAIKRKITKNDNALSIPEKAVLDAITLKELKEWLTKEFENAPLEINIVGDLNEKNTIELLTKYFGSLPERQKIKPSEKNQNLLKEPFNEVEEFKTVLNDDLVFMLIPTVDYREIEEIRKLNLLGKILKDKITNQMKSKMINPSSAEIEHYFNEDTKNMCYLRFAIKALPKNTLALTEIIDSTIKEIAEKGVTKEELEVVRKPYFETLVKFSKTNEYWLNSVLRNSTAVPRNIEATNTFPKSYEEITSQQISETAKKYLDISKKSSYILHAKPIN